MAKLKINTRTRTKRSLLVVANKKDEFNLPKGCSFITPEAFIVSAKANMLNWVDGRMGDVLVVMPNAYENIRAVLSDVGFKDGIRSFLGVDEPNGQAKWKLHIPRKETWEFRNAIFSSEETPVRHQRRFSHAIEGYDERGLKRVFDSFYGEGKEHVIVYSERKLATA